MNRTTTEAIDLVRVAGQRWRLPPESIRAVLPDAVFAVCAELRERRIGHWLVGGTTRDLLLRRVPNDVDIAVDCSFQDLRTCYPDWQAVSGEFAHLAYRLSGWQVQLVPMATFDPACNEGVENEPTTRLLQDSATRDFTLNSLYLDPSSGELFDPHGGVQDLLAGTIRCTPGSLRSMPTRPVNLLRAVRFAARLEMQLAEELQLVIQAQANEVLRLDPWSIERELMLTLGSGRAERGMGLLADLGLARHLLPSWFEGSATRAEQALARMRCLDQWRRRHGPASPVLVLAALATDPPEGYEQSAAVAAQPAVQAVQARIGDVFPWLLPDNPLFVRLSQVLTSQALLTWTRPVDHRNWPWPLKREALRLLRWRETLGAEPPGTAVMAYRRLRAGNEDPSSTLRRLRSGPRSPLPMQTEAQGAPYAELPVCADSLEEVLLGRRIAMGPETSESALVCLVAYLRLQGHEIDLAHLETELPLALDGVSASQWQRLCRTLDLQSVTCESLPARDVACMVQLSDGRCLLLLPTAANAAAASETERLAYVPWLRSPYRLIADGDLLKHPPRSMYPLHGEGRLSRLDRPPRPLVFQLLDAAGLDLRSAAEMPEAILELEELVARWPQLRAAPEAMSELTVEALLRCHRSMGAAGSPFHGCYRRVDLERCSQFLDWRRVPDATAALLKLAAGMQLKEDRAGLAPQLISLLMDFLNIHPFHDGNRRVAMAFVDATLARSPWRIDWSRISRLQMHYWIRCANAGHCKGLAQGLMGAFVPAPGRFAPS